MLMSFLPALASDFEVDGIAYTITSQTDLTVNVDGPVNRKITEVNIPETVEYGNKTYLVTSIGKAAFGVCKALTSVTIPESVTHIGDMAFWECGALTSVTIPNGVVSIGEQAFLECRALTSVTIPESVTSIGLMAFYNCHAITQLTFNAVNCLTCGENSFYAGGITNITIGDKVTTIPTNFLKEVHSSIKQLTIPNSVTSIGANAFENISIVSLTLGTGLKSIGDNAFGWIKKAFWLGDTPPKGVDSFYDMVAIYVPNKKYPFTNKSVYKYLNSKFEVDGVVYVPVSTSDRTCDVVDCIYEKEYTNVEISDKVTNGGTEMKVNDVCPYSFYENDSIQSLTLSNSGVIGIYAFCGCDNLQSVLVANNDSISDYAFSECKKLQTAEIKNNGNIGEFAFSICSMQTVKVANNGNIGDYAFLRCKKLQTAEIKNNGNIGRDAFSGCSELQTVTIGQNVSGILDGAFYECSSLKQITIPDAVTQLRRGTFEYCSSLESVTFGAGVQALPVRVFANCSSLTSISIPNNVESIGDYAFTDCINLKSLKIGDGVKDIGNWTFNRCYSLDYISVGCKVDSIGEGAFSACYDLTKFYSYSENPPVCGNKALDDIDKDICTLYVPANSIDKYRSADQWKDFLLEGMDAVSVTEIKLNVTELSMGIGETYQLTAETLPSNATNRSVVWESSNPEIVTVDDNGMLTALSYGTATIVAKSADGNCEATCLVTVNSEAGIDDVTVTLADGPYVVYNLQGMMVLKSDNMDEVKQLPAGVYIINGKKMMVR